MQQGDPKFNFEKLPNVDLNSIFERFPNAQKIYDKLKNSGAVVNLDPNGWVSVTNNTNRVISLGIKPIPKQVKEDWGIGNLDFLTEKSYILSHEGNHLVLWDTFQDKVKFPETVELLTLFSQIRKSGKGISKLGSYDFYKGTGTQHEEDLVEMLNLYSLNPDFLKGHLMYLSNLPDDDSSKFKLLKIPEIVRDHIFSKIETINKKYLNIQD